jgi:Holliday junction resolvasome RuvABC endonuclease subunit
MTKRIAGIDYSLTSPAICVWKSTNDRIFNFDGCDLYYLEKPKRRGPTPHGILNLHVEPYPEWETEEERHELLSTWAMEIVNGSEVYIEGYAFATSGKSHVRSVAENTGLLKHKMHKVKQPFTSVPPSVIKKYATGKGNANKDLMYEAFTDELLTPTDLKDRLTPKAKKLTNPVTDIVDAYFITKYGWEEFCNVDI